MHSERLTILLLAAGLMAVPAASAAPAPLRQTIVVSAPRYRDTWAYLSAYDVTGSSRRRVFGPWLARVGYNGLAPAEDKREGDGRTPSGTFGFQFMFGVNRDPGVHYPYRRAQPWDVWDDDPTSLHYNEFVDERRAFGGRAPEPLDQIPAYPYAAVIGYNTARTAGLGSAIFLHADVGGPTAGCVSLPRAELLRVLRWLKPGDDPRIRIGVAASP